MHWRSMASAKGAPHLLGVVSGSIKACRTMTAIACHFANPTLSCERSECPGNLSPTCGSHRSADGTLSEALVTPENLCDSRFHDAFSSTTTCATIAHALEEQRYTTWWCQLRTWPAWAGKVEATAIFFVHPHTIAPILVFHKSQCLLNAARIRKNACPICLGRLRVSDQHDTIVGVVRNKTVALNLP